MTFFEKLCAAQDRQRSWLCVGLDPSHSDNFAELSEFLATIITVTAPFACAFKPNLGFFLSRGVMGLDLLGLVVQAIPPNLPIILDAKFGDIGSTAQHYARFAFDEVGADAVTLSPYIGTDAIRPFLSYASRAAFILCRTSNTAGNELQTAGDPPLYEQVANMATALHAEYPKQVGLVVGATQLNELARIRQVAPALPFLVPGVGAQGGDLEVSVSHGAVASGPGPLINVGRAISYASMSADFGQAAAASARSFRDQINRLRGLPNA